MSTNREKIGRRYNELRATGLTCRKATAKVNKEFGKSLGESTVRSYGTSAKKEEEAPPSEPSSRSEQPAPETDTAPPSELSERSVHTPTDLPETTWQAIDDRIRAMVKDILPEVIHNMQNEQNIIPISQDVPTRPETIKGEGQGRRQNREYRKVSLTIDRVLWDKFKAESERSKISLGVLIDEILWRHYGRPALSYETASDTEE
jgi:hypothetical protein